MGRGNTSVKLAFLLFVFLFVNLNTQAAEAPLAATLQQFETDGCTLFIDGPASNPNLWSHCCFEHDLRYWFGGDKDDKKFSDIQLRECVKDVAGNFWANLIYTGVRAGRLSPVKFKYVWSWGWTPKRGKNKLNQSEKNYVVEQLNELELEPEFKTTFIEKYLK